MDDNNPWSEIEETRVAIEKLRLLCHSRRELAREGYVLEPLSFAQIDAKTRCLRCKARMKKRPSPKSQPKSDSPSKTSNSGRKQNKTNNSESESKGKQADTAPPDNPLPKCVYHPGRVRDKRFLCCGKHISQPGCTTEQEHDFPPYGDPKLREYWQHHPTPDFPETENRIGPAPTRHGRRRQQQRWEDEAIQAPRRPVSAIALDCEMGYSTAGEPELIRLTAVNFFTGAVLLDRLVQPSVPMQHWNTRYSGVTWAAMHDALRSGTCIFGRDMARELLWKYIRPETIVIVHGGRNDFSDLRWLHGRIIDSCILESYTGVKTEGGRSLQNLCKLKLGLAVQQKGVRVGHDSLEDAMACRELVIDWLRKIPDN